MARRPAWIQMIEEDQSQKAESPHRKFESNAIASNYQNYYNNAAIARIFFDVYDIANDFQTGHWPKQLSCHTDIQDLYKL